MYHMPPQMQMQSENPHFSFQPQVPLEYFQHQQQHYMVAGPEPYRESYLGGLGVGLGSHISGIPGLPGSSQEGGASSGGGRTPALAGNAEEYDTFQFETSYDFGGPQTPPWTVGGGYRGGSSTSSSSPQHL